MPTNKIPSARLQPQKKQTNSLQTKLLQAIRRKDLGAVKKITETMLNQPDSFYFLSFGHNHQLLEGLFAYDTPDITHYLLTQLSTHPDSNRLLWTVDNKGKTALHYALKYGDISSVKLLLDTFTDFPILYYTTEHTFYNTNHKSNLYLVNLKNKNANYLTLLNSLFGQRSVKMHNIVPLLKLLLEKMKSNLDLTLHLNSHATSNKPYPHGNTLLHKTFKFVSDNYWRNNISPDAAGKIIIDISRLLFNYGALNLVNFHGKYAHELLHKKLQKEIMIDYSIPQLTKTLSDEYLNNLLGHSDNQEKIYRKTALRKIEYKERKKPKLIALTSAQLEKQLLKEEAFFQARNNFLAAYDFEDLKRSSFSFISIGTMIYYCILGFSLLCTLNLGQDEAAKENAVNFLLGAFFSLFLINIYALLFSNNYFTNNIENMRIYYLSAVKEFIEEVRLTYEDKPDIQELCAKTLFELDIWISGKKSDWGMRNIDINLSHLANKVIASEKKPLNWSPTFYSPHLTKPISDKHEQLSHQRMPL